MLYRWKLFVELFLIFLFFQYAFWICLMFYLQYREYYVIIVGGNATRVCLCTVSIKNLVYILCIFKYTHIFNVETRDKCLSFSSHSVRGERDLNIHTRESICQRANVSSTKHIRSFHFLMLFTTHSRRSWREIIYDNFTCRFNFSSPRKTINYYRLILTRSL